MKLWQAVALIVLIALLGSTIKAAAGWPEVPFWQDLTIWAQGLLTGTVATLGANSRT